MPRSARLAILATAIGVATLIRLQVLFSDFWQDEIWQLRTAIDAPSMLALITRVHFDGNHVLVAMWLRLVGIVRDWEWYRLPSLLAGIASVPLLIRAARTDEEKAIVSILGATSLLMIVVSSEARGYALAAVLLLAAYILQQRKTLAHDLGFGVAIALAFLATLGSVSVYIAFLAADTVRREPRRHVIPVIFGAWLYFVKVRHLISGGGPPSTTVDAAIGLASTALGGPETGALAAVLAIIVFAVLAFEIVKRRDLFFAVAIFIGPALAAHRYQFHSILPRHFFVCLPFALLLFASFIARLPRAAGIALVAAFVAGNAVRVLPFMKYGHGDYLSALTDIANAGGGTVGGDFDFRNQMLIDFYRPYLPRGADIRYVQKPPARWLLIESREIHPRVGPIGPFRVAGVYPYGGYSGWTWIVYRAP